MKIADLIRMYEVKKEQYGEQTYKHVSSIFREAKKQHQVEFTGNDHEQSWRAFKGKNLEKLIEYILQDEVRRLGLKIVNGNGLERTKKDGSLSKELSMVKRNLLIDYGEFGCHLPDVDLVIYQPQTSNIVAVLSSKVTLRERVAQTGYWKLKLSADAATAHIQVYFVTPDEDGVFKTRDPVKKGRAIAETDTDGSYVLSEEPFAASKNVKTFGQLIEDLKAVVTQMGG